VQQGMASDSLGSAVQAMGKAMEQLEADRTKEALPHEMAALNGLLQAQAEIRRREIARQQATGSGSGGNRSGQDLSALFDKELQRQQQTNYETPRDAEAPTSTTAPDAALLDRIRDLARRQEDLSRRQRDASGKVDGNEARRYLEKLTREQTQLREEAAALARRIGEERAGSAQRQGGDSRPNSSSGRSSGTATSRDEGESLRAAAQQMGAAASELRRNDAAGAARSGARAAEQLRRFEARARGDSTLSGERAAAEHELEARQIAQEQRRIAAETRRLAEQGGSGASGGGKRLAAEKIDLAERVEALGRGIEQAREGAHPRPSTGEPRVELTAALESIARRMRESAARLRDEATMHAGAALGEQELARATERVTRQLGTAASPEAARLSGQLEQADAIRNRLNRLDAQVRGSRSRGGSSPVPEGHWQELVQARQMLEQLAAARPGARAGGPVAPKLESSGRSEGGSPEQEQFSRSAPGTEAFKQDRTAWESLRTDIGLALEQYEAAISSRLVYKAAEERLSAGGSEQAPDGYRHLIARYFESLANVTKAKK
ncbi:MAG: hypothetical protein M3Q85_15245, partial [Acidobacteriota bacterium]|nr:hypothetical protein [Acidobacteriota bacterium]